MKKVKHLKKAFAFVSSLLLCSAATLFAEVTAKKLADGNIEVTFFYGNPRATEVTVAGDWTNWGDGAEPMTKTDKGWTYTRVVPAGTTMKYKFISDGNWTADLKAPDTIDDGFGGKNGLVDVDVLAGSGNDSTSEGGAAATGKLFEAGKANLKFISWTHFGYQTKWDNSEDQKGVDSSGLGLKSYIKMSGTALPKVPVFLEVALAENDGFANLYKRDTLKLKDGLKNMAIDTLTEPINYWGGNADDATYQTYLGQLTYGFESPIVNWTAGYRNAKLKPHTNVNWVTVDQEWEAGYSTGGGYNNFDFAPAFRLIPALADAGVTVEATLTPNRAADRAGNQYGFFGYADVSFSTGELSHYLDFQYNLALGTTYNDLTYNDIKEEDFILGYKGGFGPVTLKVNGLASVWGLKDWDKETKTKKPYKPSSSDVTSVMYPDKTKHNVAANANLTFSNDAITANAGYRMRGLQANMMYVEDGNADDHTNIADQLGDPNTQRIFADVGYNLNENVSIGLNTYVEMVYNKDVSYKFANKNNKQLFFRPRFSVGLEDLAGLDAKVEGYSKLNYMTEKDDKYLRGTNDSQFLFEDAGLKFSMNLDGSVKNFAVIYNFDNRDTSYLFNTLTLTAEVPAGINLQLGAGLRTANKDVDDADNKLGFFLGSFKKLDKKHLWGATVYAQYMFAMDPYKSFNDGPENFDYDSDSYAYDGGASDYAQNSAIRIGLGWDL